MKPRFTKQRTAIGLIAATLAIGTPFVAKWEGVREKPYFDIAGVLTVCAGHTKNVILGERRSKEECERLLKEELLEYIIAVDERTKPELKPETLAALGSFTYNVGVGAFSRSTLLKKLNAGDIAGACAELKRWNKYTDPKTGQKRVSRGLVNRREDEFQLCMKGAEDVRSHCE